MIWKVERSIKIRVTFFSRLLKPFLSMNDRYMKKGPRAPHSTGLLTAEWASRDGTHFSCCQGHKCWVSIVWSSIELCQGCKLSPKWN